MFSKSSFLVKDILPKIGKASVVIGKLDEVWTNGSALKSIVLSIAAYASEAAHGHPRGMCSKVCRYIPLNTLKKNSKIRNEVAEQI